MCRTSHFQTSIDYRHRTSRLSSRHPELSSPQRQQVLGATKKVDMYSKIMDLRQISAAGAAIFEVRLLLRRGGIFVQAGILEEFKKALDVHGKAQVERLMHF